MIIQTKKSKGPKPFYCYLENTPFPLLVCLMLGPTSYCKNDGGMHLSHGNIFSFVLLLPSLPLPPIVITKYLIRFDGFVKILEDEWKSSIAMSSQ